MSSLGKLNTRTMCLRDKSPDALLYSKVKQISHVLLGWYLNCLRFASTPYVASTASQYQYLFTACSGFIVIFLAQHRNIAKLCNLQNYKRTVIVLTNL